MRLCTACPRVSSAQIVPQRFALSVTVFGIFGPRSFQEVLLTFCGYSIYFSWLFLENVNSTSLKNKTGTMHAYTMKTFKNLTGLLNVAFVGLCYPGSLASCSYAPFITCFQRPPPSLLRLLRLKGQVGCMAVCSVWGLPIKDLNPLSWFCHSLLGEEERSNIGQGHHLHLGRR